MQARYRFGCFDMLPDTRQLVRGGAPVVIGARAFDLLQCLIEYRERVVSKDDLVRRIWPETVVGENNLNVQVATLRKLIGPQAVVTVAGHGYRFGLELKGSAVAVDDVESSPAPRLALPDKPSIAVLPFLCLGDDPQQAYFADGVTEDITTELSRFHSLFVIARNSAFTYKGQAVDVRAVSRDLGVRYVVEGSVRRAGKRVRVVAQLIDALTGEHIWAEKYDRVVEDIFDLQEEVARAVVVAMAPQIEVPEARRARRMGPDNLSAYALAQRGWAVASASDMAYERSPRDEAFRWATQALALDTDCALALRTIALVHWWHAYHNTTESIPDTIALGLAAATRAVALDHGDHHARRWRAQLLFMAGQPEDGLAELRQAHQINPNCALTLSWLGCYEATSGDESKGVPYALEALRLSPRDPSRAAFMAVLGFAHFATGDYAASVQAAQAALREAPGSPIPHVVGAISWVGVGEIALAQAEFQRLVRIAPRLAEARLAGRWLSARPHYLQRAHTFLRIAAGMEDPHAADALR